MRWVSISLILLPTLWFICTAAAGEPPTIFFSESEPIEATHTVFKYEDGLSFIILWNEDNLKWSVTLENITLFLYDFSGEGVFPGEKGTRSIDYVELNTSAPPGEYNIIINLEYTKISGEIITKRYEYPMRYIEPLRITNIILPSNTTYGFTVEIETYVDFSELTIEFSGDGDITFNRNQIEMRDIPPGVYSLKTYVIQSNEKDRGQQEVAYHIIAINGSHIIELYEYNIDVNVEWDNESVVSNYIRYFVLISVSVIIIIVVNYFFIRRNKLRNSSK